MDEVEESMPIVEVESGKNCRLRVFTFYRLLLFAAVIYVLVTLLAWRSWTRDAEAALQAQIDAASASGSELVFSKLAQPPIPDELNAVWWYRQAAEQGPFGTVVELREKSFDVLTDQERNLLELYKTYKTEGFLNVLQSNPEAAARVLELHKTAIDLVKRGVQCDQASWGGDFTVKSPHDFMLPPLGQHRQMARIICLSAMSQAAEGDCVSVCNALETVLQYGDDIGGISIIQHLCCQAWTKACLDTLEDLAPDLTNCSDARASIRSLMSSLLETSALIRSAECGIAGEKAIIYSVIAAQPIFKIYESFGIKACTDYDIAFILDHMAKLESLFSPKVIDRAALAELRAETDQMAKIGYVNRFLLHPYSALLMPAVTDLVPRNYGCIAMRRAGAVLLALRLYEVDKGSLPESLSDLVGEYLPELPSDPFNDGKPLKYLRQGDSAIIYSIGMNGIDDGGVSDATLTKRLDIDHPDFVIRYRAEK